MVEGRQGSGLRRKKGDVDRETGEEKRERDILHNLAAATYHKKARAAEVWKLCTHIKVVSSEIDCIVIIQGTTRT